MNRWTLVCVILGSVFVPAIALAWDDTPPDEASKIFDQKLLLKEVRVVVKKYYPKAKVELKDGVIRFDYKTRIFKIHTADLSGLWQDAFDERGPQPGGIYGEIELLAGEVGSMARLPQEFDQRYYKTYLMGPYSRKLDCTVDARVSYPPREAKEFVKDFADLVNHFEKYVRKKK